MSSPAQSQPSLEAQANTDFIPLDTAVWNAWVQKCTRRERENAASRTKVVKWICVSLLVGGGNCLL